MTWRGLIPEHDRELSLRSGRGREVEPGTRPALVLVDITYGFTGRDRSRVEDAMAVYPNACGPAAWAAVDVAAALLAEARRAGVPVFYTAGLAEHRAALAGRAADKHSRRDAQPADRDEIVAELAPEPAEVVIRKARPSAFFGTPLVSALVDLGRDTLIVAGGTTSGCVRASVVDAFSYGFRVLVVEDAVFDRVELSHAVNLFDIEQKYASVQPAAEVIRYLRELPEEST